MFNAKQPVLQQTWIEVDGQVCGARPDERGPIGGGPGYDARTDRCGESVHCLDGLLEAVAQARAGDVVFIDGQAVIDCTERVYIEKLVIEVPAGVTLASDRGVDGSRGALLLSDTFATRPLIRVGGPEVRITGLRLAGPNPKPCLEHHDRSFAEGRGHEYYYKFPTSDGIVTEHPQLEVDNCELGGWSHAAVCLRSGEDHWVHHNFIHHNQYNGLGYGVSHDRASSLVERNLFNCNRHSIAGTGRPSGGYEARHNVEIGQSLSHCFDMHGGRDRKDGTEVAGTRMEIHHNTFRSTRRAIVIRGVPEEEATIHNNWFHHRSPQQAVRSEGHTRMMHNACGRRDPQLVA